MKRLMTFAIALMIGGVAFGQTRDAKNPLVSEQNYKHPFAAKAAKDKNIGVSEKFASASTTDVQDYKHQNSRKMVKRVFVRQGSGADAASSTKHPLGL